MSIDYYPEETKSLNALPKNSPISLLPYGGLLTKIGELVAIKRKKNRDNRRKFLISKINNTNMGILIDKIQNDARKLPNYISKEWSKGKKTKEGFIEFFKKTDISLKYLEDVYEYQMKGLPKLDVGDIVKIYNSTSYYGIVCNIKKMHVKFIKLTDNLTFVFMMNGHPDSVEYYTNIWKCEKMDINKTDFYNNLEKDRYNKVNEFKKRNHFLNSNPIFKDIRIPYNFYNYKINIFNGEIPKLFHNYEPHIQYNQSWNIIRDVVTNSPYYFTNTPFY
jgi:hypothetical protein